MGILAIDFFSGCGGATRGLLDSGIRVIKGIDSDSSCKLTYESNNPPAQFVYGDIRELPVRDVKKWLEIAGRDSVLFAGCPPCQPFSNHANKGSRSNDDMRSLLLSFLRFAEAVRPEFLFVENVPGIARPKNDRILRKFVGRLKQLDYACDSGLVDAKDYGVPQTRVRYILMASRIGEISLPPATHGQDLQPYLSVRDAIKKFPVIRAGSTHPSVANHSSSALSDLNLERMRRTPRNGGSRKDWPRSIWLKCHRKENSGHSDVYGRMHWNRPAPTLTCRCNSISNGRFGHPSQLRAISLREAAALQTFPDRFVFHGWNQTIARHIGNAIPVRLVEAIGEQFLRAHQDRNA